MDHTPTDYGNQIEDNFTELLALSRCPKDLLARAVELIGSGLASKVSDAKKIIANTGSNRLPERFGVAEGVVTAIETGGVDSAKARKIHVPKSEVKGSSLQGVNAIPVPIEYRRQEHLVKAWLIGKIMTDPSIDKFLAAVTTIEGAHKKFQRYLSENPMASGVESSLK